MIGGGEELGITRAGELASAVRAQAQAVNAGLAAWACVHDYYSF